jgi:hypothetical protein
VAAGDRRVAEGPRPDFVAGHRNERGSVAAAGLPAEEPADAPAFGYLYVYADGRWFAECSCHRRTRGWGAPLPDWPWHACLNDHL